MRAKQIRRVFIGLLLSFVVIFLLRFTYEVSYYIDYYGGEKFSGGNTLSASLSNSGSSYDTMTKNFVSERQSVSDQSGTVVDYEQKYEMVADIRSLTERFDEDEAAFRQSVRDVNGVIQYERNTGLPGERALSIAAGVAPGRFDELVERVRGIGELRSFSVDKTDKTNEFRSYLAQREALEKSRDAYIALKTQGGEISDLLVIEERIGEIEQRLLETGIALGGFDENQSMCTVQFSLNEQSGKAQKIGITFSDLAYCAAEALPWTLLAYILALIFLVGTAFSAVGISYVANRIAIPHEKTGKSGNKKPEADENTEEIHPGE